ncbi:MAG: hypothetical protein KBA26_10815 [Candidatus Delongbacteria bacterium]|nr:hypothetical protein [Candidatus Delongbacteria bacterium]
MKQLKYFIFCLLIIASFSSAQPKDGLIILFDNSGSMKQSFTPQQLEDAKILIDNFLFNGIYDSSKWNLSTQDTLVKIWNDKMFLYVHPYGEAIKESEPYFRLSPDYDTREMESSAKEFINGYLYNRLDYRDKSTNTELAKYYAWWKISNLPDFMPNGKNFGLLIITDGKRDTDDILTSRTAWLEQEFIKRGNQISPIQYLFTYNQSQISTHEVLRAEFFQVHFKNILDSTTSPADSFEIILAIDSSSYQRSDSIHFSWSVSPPTPIELFKLQIMKKGTDSRIHKELEHNITPPNDSSAFEALIPCDSIKTDIDDINLYICNIIAVLKTDQRQIVSNTASFSIEDDSNSSESPDTSTKPWKKLVWIIVIVLALITIAYVFRNKDKVIQLFKNWFSSNINGKPDDDESNRNDSQDNSL